MKVKIVKNGSQSLEMSIKDVDTVTLNVLRRIMISEVPTLSFDRILIRKNSSPMNDEFLAHRIGLIPLRYSKDISLIPSEKECVCLNGCSQCLFELVLQKENIDSDEPIGVYSSDFVSLDENSNIKCVTFSVFEKGILICKLAKGQKIDIQCQAIKGVGREHSKWSPVSNVCFSSIPSIKIGNVNQDLQKTISNNCPKKVFSIQENTLKVSNEKDCSFCNECVEKSKNEIIVTPSDKNFIMEIENNGSISSLDILKCSLKIWKEQLITLQNEINKL